MKVFLSVGATYSEEQEHFVSAFETFLSQNGCERLTVGRGSYSAKQPILRARELLEAAEGVVIIAFTRSLVKKAIDKPNSDAESELSNIKYPTVWNQIEAAMAFGLKLPILVILEDGLHQEAMLKDRLEFRAVVTPLQPGLFESDEFKGVFADFKEIAITRSEEMTSSANSQPAALTVGELLRDLRPDQIWKTGAALFGLLSVVAAGAYWFGKNVGAM